jgi:ergothioneine biosynthesis protein EgtB
MILTKFVEGYQAFDPDFTFLFNSYYNSVGDRVARDHRSLSRPTVARVFEYRKYVDEHMKALLTRGVDDDVRELVVLGLNHEQQHQELFVTDLKYTFGLNPLFPAYRDERLAPEEKLGAEAPAVIQVAAGDHDIGYSGDGFCFDNELARHRVYLDEFTIAGNLVTNREYLEFIHDGGYADPLLWHSDGWDWVQREKVNGPLHWHVDAGSQRCFTLAGIRPLQDEAPVCHVSWYEASAFAEWKGMRLPTEFEWEAGSSQLNWGLRWEWTASAYLPYPGFRKPAGAVGEYNGKFMINQMVLRGASVVTPEGHSRPTYRNFFHPHLRWQFTGIRLAT